MGTCFLHGMRGGGSAVGGTGLNILYGEERPETAEPETVWVSTTKGSGAYILSPEEPEGEEGLVWFQTGDSGISVTMESPVKAVFHLLNAYIYLDGSWTFLAEAGVYRDGAWILFCESYLKLYDNGDQCTDITGGYTGGGYYANYPTTTPIYNGSNVYFAASSSQRVIMCTVNRLILDRYSKLVVDWYVKSVCSSFPNDNLSLFVYDITKKKVIATLAYGPQAPRKQDALDIKDLTGEYYVAISSTSMSSSSSDRMTGYVYSLELRV